MSFSVYFTNSSKSENSTKQFTITGLTPYSCTLKDGCSVSNPVIELQIADADFLTLKNCNVAYIPDFIRYYFVTDWRRVGRLTVCSLSVDVLASFWDTLKLQSYYVTRSAYLTNKYIVDTEYPASANQRTQVVAQTANPFQPASTDYGCFVVGIVNKYGGLDGCVTYYVMGYLVFMNFMSKLFRVQNMGTTGTNNDTFTSDLAEAIINPLQYIASVMWYPFSTTSLNALGFLQTATTVYCGYTAISVTGTFYEFDNSVLHKNVCDLISFTISHHPEHNTAYSFLNLSPYSEYRLSFYPFGTFTIDGDYLQGFNTLYCLYNVDLRTGRGTLNLGTSISGTNASTWVMPANFLTAEAQIGVPIPTSTIETLIPDLGILGSGGIIAGASGLFSGLGDKIKNGFASFGGIGAKIGEVVGGAFSEAVNATGSLIDDVGTLINKSGVGSALLQTMSSPNMGGSQGAVSLYPKQDVSFSAWFKLRANLDNTHKGSPLCQVVQLSTLSGYTVCSSAVADIFTANYAEKRKIENFLNTGFYIE